MTMCAIFRAVLKIKSLSYNFIYTYLVCLTILLLFENIIYIYFAYFQSYWKYSVAEFSRIGVYIYTFNNQFTNRFQNNPEFDYKQILFAII